MSKRVLIISYMFPRDKNSCNGIFVYDQTKELNKKVLELTVIVPIPFIPGFLSNKAPHNVINANWSKDEQFKIFYVKYPTWPGRDFPFLKSIIATLFVLLFLISNDYIKYDIVHAHMTGFFTGLIGLAIKTIYRKKLVITMHGSLSCYPKLKIHRNIMCFLLKRADKIFVVSKAIQRKITKYCLVKTEVLGNGISKSIFHPTSEKTKIREELNIPQDLQVIVNIASMDKLKNHIALIKAFYEVKKTIPNIYLILISDGPERYSISNLVKKMNLENSVRFTGYIPHNNIASWLQSADIFVLPSFSEGMPVSLIEALACGLPVIGSNVGGIPDIIIDDKIGFLINPYDVSDLANKLIYALTSKWDREFIANYGETFSMDKVIEGLIKSYNDVLSN